MFSRSVARLSPEHPTTHYVAVAQGTAPEHPVTVALTPVVREGALSRVWFDRLIDARVRDCCRRGALACLCILIRTRTTGARF